MIRFERDFSAACSPVGADKDCARQGCEQGVLEHKSLPVGAGPRRMSALSINGARVQARQ